MWTGGSGSGTLPSVKSLRIISILGGCARGKAKGDQAGNIQLAKAEILL